MIMLLHLEACKRDSVITAETRVQLVSRRYCLKEGVQRSREATVRSALGDMTQEAFIYQIIYVKISRVSSRT